jgi:hypothetical protein
MTYLPRRTAVTAGYWPISALVPDVNGLPLQIVFQAILAVIATNIAAGLSG